MIGQVSKHRYSIKSRANIYDLFFDYSLLMAMLSNYFEPVTVWYVPYAVFFILVLLHNKRVLKAASKKIILLILCLVFLIGSISVSRNNEALPSNLMNMMIPLLVCLSFSLFSKTRGGKFRDYLYRRVPVLNGWWLFNIILVILQISGIPILLKSHWVAQSIMYEDVCCGMFGYHRTHELAFYSCMIMVCNFSYYQIIKKKWILAYTIITEAIMLICSYFNDNTAFYIMLPLFLMMYLLIYDAKKKNGITRKILGYLKYVILLIIALFFLLQIPSIKKIYDEYILVRINAMLFYRQVGVAGSNERSAIVEAALSLPQTWKFGIGIGSEILGEHISHGFRHFGISSMGVMLYLAGIWYFLFHNILIANCVTDTVGIKEKKSYIFVVLVVYIFIVGMSFYSPILSSTASIYWIALTFAYI